MLRLTSGRERLFATTMICGLALVGASPAFAQQDAAVAQQDAAAAPAEIVVTGSRIQNTNLTSASPISVASQEDIVLSRSTAVEEVLARLPSVDFNGGIAENSNNGGGGESVIALRNLGPQRTLVLIDGQRLIPAVGSVDLNSVPLAFVDHIDVLKDGASSIYGADAIGGVINIITKRKVNGLTADANYGTSEHGGGETYGLSSSMGVSNDKGDLQIGVSWNVRDPVQQKDRAWAVDPHSNDPNYPGGSTYRTQLDTLQNENNPNQIFINGQQYSATDPSVANLLPNTAYIAGVGKVKLNAGGDNFQTLTSGLDQKQINLAGHYEIVPGITVIADGFFTDYNAEQKLRPEPILGDTIATFNPDGSTIYPGFIVPASAPGNPTGQAITAYLTPTQFGPRDYREDSETYRMRFGFEGSFAKNFKWELGYVFQRNTTESVVANEANFQHLAQLTGQAPCTNVPGGCTNGMPNVMPNFFNGPNNIFTPAQLAYATFNNTTTLESFERYGYGDINGTLFDLPFGPLKAAIGFETREEHLTQTPDELVQEGFAPNQAAKTTGGYDVKSLYGELQVPVVNNLPFIKSLDLSPSVRWDDYSNFGGELTYKVGVNYEATQDIRFRAAYSTAIRAPEVSELFGGAEISDNGASGDPCETGGADGNGNTGKGLLTAGSTCSLAVAGGKAVTTFKDVLNAIPDNQVQVQQGGNPNLQPETARTLTGGFVATPRWTPGLTIAVDYYSIIISNTILTGGLAGNEGADFVLNGCYGPEQNASFCSDIKRDANGNIVQIESLNANIGVAKAQGIDYEVSYNTRRAHLNLPVPGYFNVDLAMTNQIKNNQTNPDGTTTQYNGFFNVNNETNEPKWKGIFTVDWAWDALKVRYDARYSRHTADLNGGPGVPGNVVPDYFYHDVSFSYDLPPLPGAKESRIVFGVNNFLDQDPPFIGTDSTCKCNTIAGGAGFDVIGRYYYTRLSAAF